jgi:hypothetical protein
MLKHLDPRQRKILAGVGVGAVLALFVVLRRRGAAGQTQDATAVTPGGTGSATGLPDGYGSTFADNGASASQLTSTVADLASEVHTLNDNLTPVAGVGGDIPPAILGAGDDLQPAASSAPGPAGQSGLVVNVNLPRTRAGKAAKHASHKTAKHQAKQPAPKRSKHAPAHRPPKPTLHERVTHKGPAHNHVTHPKPHKGH